MILDTNALSAMARKDRGLLAKLRDARHLAVTLISLGEYDYGIAHSRLKNELQLWLQALWSTPQSSVRTRRLCRTTQACAASCGKRLRRFRRTTAGSQLSFASMACLCSAVTSTSIWSTTSVVSSGEGSARAGPVGIGGAPREGSRQDSAATSCYLRKLV